MKKILFIAAALCFVGAGSFEVLSQKRAAVSKKTVTRKFVKCKVNGKIVYRARCRTKSEPDAEPTLQIPVIVGSKDKTAPSIIEPIDEGVGIGNGQGTGSGQGSGRGAGIGNGMGSGDTEKQETVETKIKSNLKSANVTQNVRIISKPRAIYTDEAKKNMVQGNVVLRVTFLANGRIGSIIPVAGLSDGLTDRAIEAARKIRFEPAMKNGKPISKTMTISYSFTIY